VNWRHLEAFIWLRWRLRVNQLKKAGTANAVITVMFAWPPSRACSSSSPPLSP